MDGIKKAVGDILRSKKVKIFLMGLLANVIVSKLKLDAELAAKITEYIYAGTLTLIGGQALADFGSGGKTSANQPDNIKANEG